MRVVFSESMDFNLEMWKYARYGKRIASNPLVGHEHVPNFNGFLMGVNVKINSK